MYKYKTLTTLVLVIAAAGLSACYSSAYDEDRGQSVRSMISNQTLNPSALELSATETTGQDAQKADVVLEAYRGSVGDPKNIKSGDSTTIQVNR